MQVRTSMSIALTNALNKAQAKGQNPGRVGHVIITGAAAGKGLSHVPDTRIVVKRRNIGLLAGMPDFNTRVTRGSAIYMA